MEPGSVPWSPEHRKPMRRAASHGSAPKPENGRRARNEAANRVDDSLTLRPGDPRAGGRAAKLSALVKSTPASAATPSSALQATALGTLAKSVSYACGDSSCANSRSPRLQSNLPMLASDNPPADRVPVSRWSPRGRDAHDGPINGVRTGLTLGIVPAFVLPGY